MGKISEFIKKNRTLLIVLSIIALFLLLRIPALNQEVYGDELYNYYYAYSSYTPHVSFDPTAYSSFFMSIIFYRLAFTIYPSIISLRLVSMLFGLGILLLGMKTLDSFFNRRAAMIFGIIYSLVPWAVFTSVLLDNDGTITTFMFMVLIYFTLKFFHKDNLIKDGPVGKTGNRHLIIIGIVSGAMILLKYALFSSIIVFYILMLAYYLWYVKRMAFRKAAYKIYVYCVSTVISTIVLLSLYALLLGPTAVSFLVKHYADIPHNNFTFGGISFTFILEVILLLMMISPIVIVFFLKLLDSAKGIVRREGIAGHEGIIRRNNTYIKDNYIKDNYIVLISIFYILELSALLYAYNFASMNRYAAFLIVPITLLSAIYLSRFLDNKRIWVMAVCSFLLSGVYFLIDLLPHRILDFYPKAAWISSVLHLRWNFFVPINGASGPIGFYISFLSIALSFGICLILAVWAIVLLNSRLSGKKKEKNLSRVMFILSIVALSYCVYVSLQFSYSITSPSISSINRELRHECAPQGYLQEYYVFKNNAGFAVQNMQNLTRVKIITYDLADNSTFADQVVTSGENVCIVDFPQLGKSSIFWKDLNDKCMLEKTYSSRGYDIGYWFKC